MTVLVSLRRALSGCIIAALFSSVASAQQTPPPPAPPRPFQLPTPATISLDNGLKATFIDFGVVPKVTIAVVIRTGGLNQGGKIWLSSLTCDLLEEGTQNKSSAQLAEAAASMGGALSIGAGDDESLLSLDVLAEYGSDAIALLAEVLTQPLLPESELPRLKQNYRRSLSVSLTQPQSLAGAAFAEALYPGHPYGDAFPTPEQLDSYSIEDVRQYYADNFGARRTHIYIAGRFDRAALEQAIRDRFGQWRKGPYPLIQPPPKNVARTVKLIDRPDAPQSTLRIGQRVIDPTQPGFTALSLANTLLGGALTSRITMNLRETKGWAYSPSSALSTNYHDASWAENADVKAEVTGPALVEIFKEIEALRAQPPQAAELDAVKNYRNGIFVLSSATRSGLISQLTFMNLQELPYEWLTSYVERLYAVTPEQISQAVQQQLDPAQMSVVVVGDLATVREQLESVDTLAGAIP